MSFRSGIGYDVHRLVEGRPLVLGGVTVLSDRGLDGHPAGAQPLQPERSSDQPLPPRIGLYQLIVSLPSRIS